MYKTLNNRGSPIEDITLKEEINNMGNFAIMIEQEDGSYIESTSTSFPTNYTLNLNKSKCADKDGNILNNALSVTEDIVQVKTTTTTYCYLYFDIPNLNDLCESYENINECIQNEDISSVQDIWDSTLEGDGYRYTGVDPSNYICFGTTNQSECMNEPDKYMYRIIGIFGDSEGTQHLKLIKKEALSTTYEWHSDSSTDTDWDNSDLYNGLNSSYFVSNTEYSYMQDVEWYNKIETWEYTATNTLTYENSGLNYYKSITAKDIYLHEMNRSSKTSEIGEWKTISSKIGLMYVSDYFLALGFQYINTVSNSNSTFKKSWIDITNNESAYSSEWTMTRYGSNGGYYNSWQQVNGGISSYKVNNYLLVRPVFYLTSDTKISNGSGTNDDPYLIFPSELTDTEKLIENVSSDVLWDSTLEGDDYRYVGTDPSNYICFGYSDASIDCDFTNATNSDLYAYRIIGIFEDNKDEKHLKLIKKEALNTAYAWHSDYETDTDWDASDLYNGINGSYFLSNTTYSYMQDSNWTNKIATWNYTATNTLQDANYTSEIYGIQYYRYNTVSTIYLHEMNRNSKTNQTCYYSSTIIADCNTGEWKNVSSKIGVMYASDYLLSLGHSVLQLETYDNRTTLITGWMFLSNNDSEGPSQDEWTMTRRGLRDGGSNYAMLLTKYGINGSLVYNVKSIRPVFYLESDVSISGDGTIESPYVIN